MNCEFALRSCPFEIQSSSAVHVYLDSILLSHLSDQWVVGPIFLVFFVGA